MVITDPRQTDNPIIFCNQAFQTLTGYDREEIIGRNCRFLQGPETDASQVKLLGDAIAAGSDIDIDLLNYRKDGTTFWNALYVSPVRNPEGEIQFFFASQMDVTERISAQDTIAEQKAEIEREVQARTAELKSALAAEKILLHEVDHRVKNNLTMIGSLIRLQARRIDIPQVTVKLEEMLERIDALAAVHKRLYQSDDITKFDLGAFVSNLVTDVIGASGRENIKLVEEIDKVEVPSTDATALGLVINEIVTNAIKHGYADGRAGVLTVITRVEDGEACILVQDDGPGMPAGAVEEGLGRTLISRLSRQVRATASWEPANPGTRVTICFPLEA